MRIGKSDRRITVERYTTSTNAYGERVQTWSTLLTVWAELMKTGEGMTERISTNQDMPIQRVRFKIRSSKGVRRQVHLVFQWKNKRRGMSDLTIYHNPRCSKSRQTLELIRGKGVEPEIVLYLEDVPAAEDIQDALQMLGMRPMDLIRKSESEFKEHFAGADELTDEQLIDLMRLYPKVIERPIVVNKGKAVIGRPPENVLGVLP